MYFAGAKFANMACGVCGGNSVVEGMVMRTIWFLCGSFYTTWMTTVKEGILSDCSICRFFFFFFTLKFVIFNCVKKTAYPSSSLLLANIPQKRHLSHHTKRMHLYVNKLPQ